MYITYISLGWQKKNYLVTEKTRPLTNFFFFSIHTYTHVKFEQLHKYIQKRNKIYKTWYTQRQSLDIKIVWYI